MKTKLMLPLLAIAALVVTPACANWFHNPDIGINRNIGSAPNPTPEDLRAMRVPIVVKDENNSGATTAQAVTPAKPVGETAKGDTLVSMIARALTR